MADQDAIFAAAIDRLSGVLIDDVTLDSVMQLVIVTAAASIAPCDAASVSVLSGNGARFATINSTSPEVVTIDRVQYTTGQGPCVTTMREGTIVVVDLDDEGPQWPGFVTAARERGVTSIFSSPLSVRGKTSGALNLYSHQREACGNWDHQPIAAFAASASVLLANATAFATSAEKNAQLEQALVTRELIGQAKGILMQRHDLNAEEAFDRLRIASQNANRKLRDVAQDIVDGKDPAMGLGGA